MQAAALGLDGPGLSQGLLCLLVAKPCLTWPLPFAIMATCCLGACRPPAWQGPTWSTKYHRVLVAVGNDCQGVGWCGRRREELRAPHPLPRSMQHPVQGQWDSELQLLCQWPGPGRKQMGVGEHQHCSFYFGSSLATWGWAHYRPRARDSPQPWAPYPVPPCRPHVGGRIAGAASPSRGLRMTKDLGPMSPPICGCHPWHCLGGCRKCQ